jgi:broad specificity phosphatase PhoE
MSYTQIHLVRHGEVHNPERVLYGRLPGYRLSARGELMAQAVARHFADGSHDVALLTASPLLRAQQTAAPIGRDLGLEVGSDDRLIEAENRFEGLTVGKGTGSFLNPRHWPSFVNFVRPGWGEPYAEQAERVRAAALEAVARAEGREAVLVLHQLPIWVTRLSAEGKRLWHDPRSRSCRLASVTTLHFDEGRRLIGTSYAEPAAHLLADAVDVAGQFDAATSIGLGGPHQRPVDAGLDDEALESPRDRTPKSPA